MPADIEISYVMTDYELALRRAIITVFEGVNLKGCWFHYAKAVYMKCK